MVENTLGHLTEQSTKVIKAVAVRNDGFYLEWYSWFTAYESKAIYAIIGNCSFNIYNDSISFQDVDHI